ncbi:ABC transporter permease [Peribacillus glennii]|uniref:ABC transporter permease n=1 Tax=Peribacillus glennii TaxID=2303991 RepID=A0A372LJR9_9BACI|nr:ABC transporter permease [Peribacillus glennii]RFU66720.1 ABC transporter permease [Peribacillus glennii]
MSGDGLIWLILLSVLLISNVAAIQLYKKNKLPLWLGGVGISILGPVIGFLSGSIFVKMAHNAGETGEGAALGAAFIGLVILGNGIIVFLIGIILAIVKFTRSS